VKALRVSFSKKLSLRNVLIEIYEIFVL